MACAAAAIVVIRVSKSRLIERQVLRAKGAVSLWSCWEMMASSRCASADAVPSYGRSRPSSPVQRGYKPHVTML
jgi:hypothetical protein